MVAARGVFFLAALLVLTTNGLRSAPVPRASGALTVDEFVKPSEPVAQTTTAEPTHDEHDNTAKHVMLTTFMLLTLGLVTNFLLDRWCSALPYTCVVFAQGVMLAYLANGTDTFGHGEANVFYKGVVEGVTVWQNLDAHFGLFLFLPPLIFAEAMGMDMAMLRAVFWQAVILAVPGVIIGCALTAASTFYMFPYDWGWEQCILFGSILSATDPVAVIAVFNSLGVAPKLKMLVSGESVFNDGTAVVLFEFCLMVVRGTHNDPEFDLASFVTFKCFVGPAAGMILGYMGVCMVKWTSKGTFDADSTIQLAVTLCCGYLAFILAELEWSSSGVLTVCAAGVVFAAKAGTKFVNHESVHSVWHMIEFCGNTLVFMVAGMIFARAFHPSVSAFKVEWNDWIVLFLNYLMAMVIRVAMLILMYIPLYFAGPKISCGEFIVMAWAGLRGAVGLLMAVMVTNDKKLNMPQVAFHVGGLATLTLVINATLTPQVLKLVGMTKISDLQLKMVAEVESKVIEEASAYVRDTLADDMLFADVTAADVLSLLPTMVQDISAVDEMSENHSTAADDDGVKLEMLRGVMLRCLHSVYHEMTEERVLAKRSKISEVLAESTKHAMLFCDGALCDLSYVKNELMLTWFDNEENYNQRYWKVFQKCRLYRNYRRYLQHKVTACIAFIYAHKEAGEMVASFYSGGDDSNPCPALELLEQESARQVVAAQTILDAQDPMLVAGVRRKMAVAKSLNFQLKKVEDLAHKGVLSEADAGRITEKFMLTLATVSDDDKLLSWEQM